MTSFIRENPFARKTNFQSLPNNSSNRIFNQMTGFNDYSNLRVLEAKIIPFQKLDRNKMVDKKDYKSEDKINDQNYRYYGTYFPLSRYENRKRLRELDTENWKRQKEEQERYKLNQYGSQALRYSSYSTQHSSFSTSHFSKPKYFSKPSQKQIKKQEHFNQSNRSQNQYMLYPKNDFQSKDKYFQPNHNYVLNKKVQEKSNQNKKNYDRIQYVEDHENTVDYKNSQPNDKYPNNFGIQRKQTSYFNDNKEKIEDGNSKNQLYFQKQTSFGQYGSDDEDYNSKPFPKNGQNDYRNLNSYGSNMKNQRFYDSDYINQQDESETKGPLHQMKFSSSSYDSEVQQTHETKFSSFRKAEKGPDRILYDGREFYKIDVVL